MACTADVTSDSRAQCFKVGMNQVATKPIVKETLRALVVDLTQERHVGRENG
jgi:CheY-like chemotaxis protein